jgi:hypothetical protein
VPVVGQPLPQLVPAHPCGRASSGQKIRGRSAGIGRGGLLGCMAAGSRGTGPARRGSAGRTRRSDRRRPSRRLSKVGAPVLEVSSLLGP